VHEATSKDNGEKFAVKCIKKQQIEGEDIKLLKREIQIMKQLSHPNILKLFEVYEDDQKFYLVMELVQGKELFDKIVERGQYSEKDAAHIVRQILSAVQYLHANDIAHRDLKVCCRAKKKKKKRKKVGNKKKSKKKTNDVSHDN
jgi:calcium/calmodulin-dependent protein kinase I